MEYIIHYLDLVPGYVWQIIAFLLPSNRLFAYIREKIGTPAVAR